MLKFRTMYEVPESYDGPRLTSNNDERITRFGKWLRDTKLNELPQLWNVMIGEMSLVGPRPEDADFTNQWPEEIRNKVLSVRPGITSPASIIYRDEEKQLDGINFLDDYLKKIMPDKLRLDLLYVDTHSFAADLDVIFMTLISYRPHDPQENGSKRRRYSPVRLYGFYSQHLTWFILDFIVTYLSVGIAGLIWRATEVINLGVGRGLLIALVVALIFSVISTLFGLHKIVWKYASPVMVIDIAFSVLLTAGIVMVANRLIFPAIILPLDFIANAVLMMIIGLITIRYRERLITGVANRWVNLRSDKKTLGEKVLVVGAGAGGELAVWLLHKSEFASAFSIVGYVDDDYRKQKSQMAGYPVLGTSRDITRLGNRSEHWFDPFQHLKDQTNQNANGSLRSVKKTDARVIVIPDLIEVLKNPSLE